MDLNPWKELDTIPPSQPPQPSTPDPALTLNAFSKESSDSGHDDQAEAPQPLTEFDPLTSMEEQAARDAWQTSEGHLPQQPQKSQAEGEPPAPAHNMLPFLSSILPSSLSGSPPSRSSSPFPTLASLAKTFSLPNLTRARPVSVDAPKSVTSQSISNVGSQEATETTEANGEVSISPTFQETDEQVQFDFQKFLDQMKSRSAEPVSKYLRSFLTNFTKRQIIVSDQVRIIGDFLNFIAVQMRSCEVWKNSLDPEFDNALEGMEKLVMNRLYDFTFAPQAAQAVPPKLYNPDDLERDRVLAQRISLFGWIEECHLDIPVDDGSQGFIMFAQQELLKINHYKAPRDKLICILNCCKVIFGLIRHLKKEEGADSFLPILIYVIIKANPPHLMSNVEFINRFRNPVKLQGEVGYYLSSLTGAISFIETMDHTSLSNITKEGFENNVEAAIQALPHSNPQSPIISRQESVYIAAELEKQPNADEESAQPLALSTPALVNSLGEDARKLLQKTGDTISKPLTAIGRIFSEALDEAENKFPYLPGPFAPFESSRERRAGGDGQQPHPQTPTGAPPLIQTPYKARVRKVPPPHISPNTMPYSPSPATMAGLSLEDTPSRGVSPWQTYTPPQSAGSQQQIHSPVPRGYSAYPHPEQFGYQQVQSAPQLPPRNQPRFQAQVAGSGGGVESSGLNPGGSPGLAGSTGTASPPPYLASNQSAHDMQVNATAIAKETLIQIFPATDVEVIDLVLETHDGDLGKSIEALLELSSGQ